MNAAIYNLLATLLSYPDEPTSIVSDTTFNACHSERSEESAVQSSIFNLQSAIGCELSLFHDQVHVLAQHQLQELFIQTFDLNPVCSLEMGWHLFGET